MQKLSTRTLQRMAQRTKAISAMTNDEKFQRLLEKTGVLRELPSTSKYFAPVMYTMPIDEDVQAHLRKHGFVQEAIEYGLQCVDHLIEPEVFDYLPSTGKNKKAIKMAVKFGPKNKVEEFALRAARYSLLRAKKEKLKQNDWIEQDLIGDLELYHSALLFADNFYSTARLSKINTDEEARQFTLGKLLEQAQ
ncbi:MAG: hypothetical protein MHM6MM_001169 [Cercozoa sp. M6MM]